MGSDSPSYSATSSSTSPAYATKELAASDWAAEWGATRTVSDRAGGTLTVPGRPWLFSPSSPAAADASAGQELDEQIAALQGEHNAGILRELGFDDDVIGDLFARGALVQPSRG